MVRWWRSGLVRSVAGGTFTACDSDLLFSVVQGRLVEKGIYRHSGKRPPPRCSICFATCVLGTTCEVSPHLFQEGRTVEVMVVSQASLDHYLLKGLQVLVKNDLCIFSLAFVSSGKQLQGITSISS